MVWDLGTMRFLNETCGESDEVKAALTKIDVAAFNISMNRSLSVVQNNDKFVVLNEVGKEVSSHSTLFNAYIDIKEREPLAQS